MDKISTEHTTKQTFDNTNKAKLLKTIHVTNETKSQMNLNLWSASFRIFNLLYAYCKTSKCLVKTTKGLIRLQDTHANWSKSSMDTSTMKVFFSMNQLHFIMFFHLHLSTNNSKKSSFTKSLNDINLNLQNDNLGLKSYFYRLILYTLAVFHLYFSYNYWHLSHYCLWQDMMETIQESCHKKTCPWRCAFCVDSDQPSYGHFNFFHLCVCVHWSKGSFLRI